MNNNMKAQLVYYRDLFNPDEVIEAKNKLVYTRPRYSIGLDGHKVSKHSIKCRCRHPKIISDYCVNGRCRHSIQIHGKRRGGE